MKRSYRAVIPAFLVAIFLIQLPAGAEQITESVKKARREISLGRFQKANQILEDAASRADGIEKKDILWEKERIRRILLDYNLTEEEVIDLCQQRIKGFKTDEFHKWEKEGKFDARLVDGKKMFFGASVSNLYKRYPEIRKRFKSYLYKDPWDKKILEEARRIKEAGKNSPSPYVVPLELGVKQSITPKKNATKKGETVRVWIPYPRLTPYQKQIRIIQTSPKHKSVDKPESVIRSVYFEGPGHENSPTTFTVEYEYVRYAICMNIDPEKVESYTKDATLAEYTKEEPPNIVFTSELEDLARKIVGDEQNPYLKGRLIYNWISENIVYSYAREYSTLLNIPMYVYENRYGDCGQLGLLFITLCRISGVPAAWRSGWECMGGESFGMHDWAAVYIRPYGWIPVDPYMGVWAVHESTLDYRDSTFLKDFYYGNMDPWRLQANSRNNAKLSPSKDDFRSETVDFQRGEIESGGRNLYFNEFSRRMKLTSIRKLPSGEGK